MHLFQYMFLAHTSTTSPNPSSQELVRINNLSNLHSLNHPRPIPTVRPPGCGKYGFNGETSDVNFADLFDTLPSVASLDFNKVSLIFLTLWALIILSLLGTFRPTASPVHKVISLLLLSICVVFL
jgi:hypothetical protein